MVFKQLNRVFQSLFLEFFLSVSLLLGVGHNLAIAAPLTGPRAIAQVVEPSVSDASLDLKAAVDRTLTAIPAGYYKIDDVAGLKRLQANSKALLVDVREPAEYGAGHIPGAINMPLRTLAQHLDEIERDRPVVLYCSSGYRSAMGVVSLHLLGYDNVQGFPPSFAGWKKAGERIAK
ncbi:rhodanese-like domain-containing protein [Nodosilinea sp. LEGE 07298]|uniref:rhodanese-like domain-containing protein n=1 Tax=Nodosilinea sp. LEGE 07298 TaxID=2777970 RepID=UPI0018815D35|nr:rhodanese-like domain-containing protein [Nodosilinea sp. LEGE 07298]MBE9109215.1 rhodanese-like domain-containing protein [Nodosilinea sp. LEGE 07298]